MATRTAYGNALCRIYPAYPQIAALDGKVSNPTRSDRFKEEFPGRFFEMYIAEQNLAMFRTVGGGVVLHPCDAVSTEKLVEAAARHRGIVYLRTMRRETPILYAPGEEFHIGGCKILRRSDRDAVTIVGAGTTVHEALAACEELKRGKIFCRVIDLYSIKPFDEAALLDAARTTRAIVTVEDHYPEGGLGEAVMSAVAALGVPLHPLAVRRKPRSGTPEQLREFEEISSGAIVRKVKEIVKGETASTVSASTSMEKSLQPLAKKCTR